MLATPFEYIWWYYGMAGFIGPGAAVGSGVWQVRLAKQARQVPLAHCPSAMDGKLAAADPKGQNIILLERP